MLKTTGNIVWNAFDYYVWCFFTGTLVTEENVEQLFGPMFVDQDSYGFTLNTKCSENHSFTFGGRLAVQDNVYVYTYTDWKSVVF
jgi:hypothetical protein